MIEKIEKVPDFVKNYLNLENNISIEQIKILNNLFEKIDTFELKSINILYDGLINDGLTMIPCQKIKMNNLNSDMGKYILNLIHQKLKEEKNIEKIYFYKTLINLINKINYINIEEQVLFNFLFDELGIQNKEITEIINGEKKYIIK
jgi:hypothetical protein